MRTLVSVLLVPLTSYCAISTGWDFDSHSDWTKSQTPTIITDQQTRLSTGLSPCPSSFLRWTPHKGLCHSALASLKHVLLRAEQQAHAIALVSFPLLGYKTLQKQLKRGSLFRLLVKRQHHERGAEEHETLATSQPVRKQRDDAVAWLIFSSLHRAGPLSGEWAHLQLEWVFQHQLQSQCHPRHAQRPVFQVIPRPVKLTTYTNIPSIVP